MTTRVNQLESLGFVDPHTRALFVDLAFYNAQACPHLPLRTLCFCRLLLLSLLSKFHTHVPFTTASRSMWAPSRHNLLGVALGSLAWQIDQVVVCRNVFEQLPTGVVVASLDVDAVPLFTDLRVFKQDKSTVRRAVGLALEIILYVCVFLYLTRASDDILIAGSVEE